MVSAKFKRRFREGSYKAFVLIILLALSALFIFPFVWMLSTALKTQADMFAVNAPLFSKNLQWGNFEKVFKAIPFVRYILNSVFITALVVFGSVISSSIVAYAFARLKWPGRDICFAILLATMMLPAQILMLPSYIMYSKIGWTNTYLPLIVPYFGGGGAFNIFLLRQFYRSTPMELSESARIDGSSELRIWWSILLPLCKPVLATIAIFAYIYSWNDFTGPLIYIHTPSMDTIALGLRAFQQQRTAQWDLMMSGSIISLIPTLILFFSCQKYFVEGIKMSGIKG